MLSNKGLKMAEGWQNARFDEVAAIFANTELLWAGVAQWIRN